MAGAAGRTFSFRVARPADARRLAPDFSGLRYLKTGPRRAARPWQLPPAPAAPAHAPGLQQAAHCVTRMPTRRAAHGLILVAPRSRPDRRASDQHGVMLFSRSEERLLWYKPSPGPSSATSRRSPYRGPPMLAFHERPTRTAATSTRCWTGTTGHRDPDPRTVRVRDGLHDLQLTGRGTAYVGAYDRCGSAASAVVTDYVVREIVVDTGRVVFEWHSLDHVPLSDSYVARPRRGALGLLPRQLDRAARPSDGTVIVSARNTSAIYGIDRDTGEVRWTLGGKRDQFGLAAAPRAVLRAARRAPAPGRRLTLFDNGGPGNTEAAARCTARGSSFRLDPRSGRRGWSATSRRAARQRRRGMLPVGFGSARTQPNGDVLVDWGTSGLSPR